LVFQFTDKALDHLVNIKTTNEILVNTTLKTIMIKNKVKVLEDFVLYENKDKLMVCLFNKTEQEIMSFLYRIKDYDKFKIVSIELDSNFLISKSMRNGYDKILVKILNTDDYNYCYLREDIAADSNNIIDKKIYTTIFGDSVVKIPKFKARMFDASVLFEDDINADVRYYLANIDSAADIVPSYRIANIDIETNASVDVIKAPAEIISCVLHDSFTGKYQYYLYHPEIISETIEIDGENYFRFSDEKKMLRKLIYDLKQFDIITGWNILSFDMLYIVSRFRTLFPGESMNTISPLGYVKFNLNIDADRYDFKNFNIAGIDLIDAMSTSLEVLKWKIDRPENMALDTVAKFLFEDKAKIDTASPAILWKEKRFDELLAYNKQDVVLVHKIIDRLNSFGTITGLRKIIPWINISQCQYNSVLIDRMMLHEYSDKIFPSKKYVEHSKLIGAEVLDPVPGIHNNTAIFDYKSMYPSIIDTFKISIDTISSTGDVKINNIKFDSTKKGLLPSLVGVLLKERTKYKKLKDDATDELTRDEYLTLEIGIKQLNNSLYGICGFPSFRLYSLEVASSITEVGRFLIEQTKAFVEQLTTAEIDGKIITFDAKVVAGDTDSVFIRVSDYLEGTDVENIFRWIEDKINENMENFVKAFTKNEDVIKNHKLQIEYETKFDKLILPAVKKKYVGMVSKFKGRKLDVPKLYTKGFAIIKKDTPQFIKIKLTELVISILVDHKDLNKLRSITSKIYLDIKNIEYTQLMISKSMSQNIEDYKKVPPHVKAMIYSNENFGSEFSRLNYKGGLLYVKCTALVLFAKKDKTIPKVIMLDADMPFPENFKVDYDKYYDLFIKSPIEKLVPELALKIFTMNTLRAFMVNNGDDR